MTPSRYLLSPCAILAISVLLLLGTSLTQNSVLAQSGRKVYLPLIMKKFPPTKAVAGVHMGNHPNVDWNNPVDLLARMRASAEGNDYPRVAVVLSNQLYTIHRSPTGACNIVGATVRLPHLYNYLTEAIRNKGTIVVIRIYPSPGNFTDWSNPGSSHTLLTGSGTPDNAPYCNGNFRNFRSIYDLVDEMNAIYNLNTNSINQWPGERIYFEPANEPNSEWYFQKGSVIPNVDSQYAWQDMDAYFSALYDRKQAVNSNIKVLTPPMAQGTYAELKQFGTCTDNPVIGGGGGYDWMRTTFQVKNDGWSWHNYWRSGLEFWQDAWCSRPSIVSDHVSQYFPDWLRTTITNSSKPAFITEADLLSPCVNPPNPHLTNKDNRSDAAQESIYRFIREERVADYIAVWLISNQDADPPMPNSGQNVGNCNDPTGNPEQAWHEAYRRTAYLGTYERAWFRAWWLREP